MLAVSPGNLPALLAMAGRSEAILLAYGKLHRRFQGVAQETLAALAGTGWPLTCLRVNRDGSASHPLYLNAELDPIPFVLPG